MHIEKWIFAAGLSVFFSLPVQGSLLIRDQNGIRLQEDDGRYKTGWHEEVNGDWYYFDPETGNAKTGLTKLGDSCFFFQEDNGVLQTNCKKVIDGMVWQFDGNGYGYQLGNDYQGWMNDSAGWRYRLSDGGQITGAWYNDEGRWFYFDQRGYMVTGAQNIDGAIYYFDTDGHMLSDTTVTLPDGTSYTLTSDGSAKWPFTPIVSVPPEEQKSEEFHLLDSMCDDILSSVTTPQMSKRQKAERIYNWVKGHMQYVSRESGEDWVHEAVLGIRSGRGDCFTYYALAQALLTRCGIPCIRVIRSTDNNHYWLLVQVEEGWFHLDCTPRAGVNQAVCLLTDAQLSSLPKAYSWIFDHSLYPRTP